MTTTAPKRTHVRSAARLIVALCVLALAGACEDDAPAAAAGGAAAAAKKPAAAAAPGAAGAKGKGAAAADAPPEKLLTDTMVFKDEDFIESEHNRDPFRSYLGSFGAKGPDAVARAPDQRPVIMPQTAVEAMKLIAVISGLPRPKAMLLDTIGVGYVVERGDYVGRAKVIQAAGNVQMVLNWRVDRIRENEVVLTCQDPTDPTHAPTVRVISMSGEKK